MTPLQFDASIQRLLAAAWDDGFTAGLKWAAYAIAGERPQETANPYREVPHVADN